MEEPDAVRRRDAHAHLLFALATSQHDGAAYEQLWPLIVGTLVRQAEAREGTDKTDIDEGERIRRECLLAGLLRFGCMGSAECEPSLDHILAIIASEKTPEGLKAALYAFLCANTRERRVSESPEEMVCFLMKRIVQEKRHDTARACAILALDRWLDCLDDYESKAKWAHVREFLTCAWGAPWDPALYPADFSDGEDDNDDQDEPVSDEKEAAEMTVVHQLDMGVLSKAALALVALRRLRNAPVQAIEHALSVLVDDSSVRGAWASVADAGSWLLTSHRNTGPVAAMVSEEFMASVYDQVEAYREAMERANASRHEWEDEQPTVPSLRAPKAVPFIKVLLQTLVWLEAQWAKQQLMPRLLDHLAQAAASPTAPLCRCR